MDRTFLSLSRQIGEALLGQHWQISTAESCTGGWLARCITDVPGSSEWFGSGYVTYSNEAKQKMLGVPAGYFTGAEAPGAVSAETVTAMAEGALKASGAQFAVATSGIAGPGGGSAAKPVGTVWFGFARAGGATRTLVHCFPGDRRAVRAQTVAVALEELAAQAG